MKGDSGSDRDQSVDSGSEAGSEETIRAPPEDGNLLVDKPSQAKNSDLPKAPANAQLPLNLPTDKPRLHNRSLDEAKWPIRIGVPLSQLLRNFANKENVDMHVVLLTAWVIVSFKLTSQEDFSVVLRGISFNLKSESNTILNIELSGEPNTIQLIERVKRAILSSEHQDSDLGFLQVAFNWYTQEPNATAKALVFSNAISAGFELELHLQEMSDHIVGVIHYATALFEYTTIERYAGYLSSVLEGMVSDPAQSITKIDILSPSERTLLLQTWNATQESYPSNLCMYHLFEQQAASTPDVYAIVHMDQSLTYEELNTRSNRLAHHLVKLGVQLDSPVAICTERSIGMIIGILAILKAGGAYVPLDPFHPSERLKDILNDTAPTILVADQVGQDAIRKIAMSTLTVVDPNTLPQEDTTVFKPVEMSSRNIAYIIYTSGSTGKPKGVMVEHQGGVNLVYSRPKMFKIHVGSRFLQFGSYTFSHSVSEIFSTLTSGATLYILENDIRLDRNQLWDYMQENSITHTCFTSSLLQDCMDMPPLESLQALITIGEALLPSLLLPLKTLVPNGMILNNYGSTETTSAIVWKCSEHFVGSAVPMGRPIANK
ncbi:hypothetical protein BGZ49_000421, partial [Haplosporangium sp. Z 27]